MNKPFFLLTNIYIFHPITSFKRELFAMVLQTANSSAREKERVKPTDTSRKFFWQHPSMPFSSRSAMPKINDI